MNKSELNEYIIFAVLIAIVLAGSAYFVYRAAYNFDPYYRQQSELAELED